ncbi:hypothetical protein [Shimia ponticola]|uniref:hypothetical protein n=1 Tax=Shimia ponticola TaxID=2582893 RepID=UPI00164A45B2|nr:hypothetical protein [Shimia ponticola]
MIVSKKTLLMICVAGFALAGCMQDPAAEMTDAQMAEADAARAAAIEAECKLYEGTGITPAECQ